MPRALFTLLTVPVFTLIFGLPALLFSILLPRSNTLALFARPWAKCILATAGVKVVIRRPDNPDRLQHRIYLSNHQSNLDVLAILVSIATPVRFVAKKVLFYIPFFGQCMWVMGMIPIDRSRRGRAIQSLEKAIDRIRQGVQLLFFCEGTRSRDGRLLPFKKGAFVIAARSGVPVVPVTVDGSGRLLPKGGAIIRPGTITIHYGQPIPTAGYGLEGKDELMLAVRKAMLEQLNQTEGSPGTPGALKHQAVTAAHSSPQAS
jgi:1-acyl-sn-glycerol-3-phosphate acyltransferase